MALSVPESPAFERPGVRVRAAVPGDLAQMVHVMARAFCDNPAMVTVLGGSTAERERILRCVLPAAIAAYMARGACLCAEADGELRAAMLTLPPGRYPMPLRFDVKVALRLLRESVGATLRFAKVDAMMRRRHIAHPHHYLFMVGTDPDHQGRGLGGALLRELAGRAASTGHPCYLETDKPSSVRLYERNGYAVTSRELVEFGREPFTMWYMERPSES